MFSACWAKLAKWPLFWLIRWLGSTLFPVGRNVGLALLLLLMPLPATFPLLDWDGNQFFTNLMKNFLIVTYTETILIYHHNRILLSFNIYIINTLLTECTILDSIMNILVTNYCYYHLYLIHWRFCYWYHRLLHQFRVHQYYYFLFAEPYHWWRSYEP